MSSIAGFFQPNTIYSKENEFCIKTIHDMSQALIHRGPDEQSFHYFPQGAFNQNFLLAGYIPGTFRHEMQPITRNYKDNSYTLLFDGFISNPEEIAMDLEVHRFHTEKMSLEELLLFSFLYHKNPTEKIFSAFFLLFRHGFSFCSLFSLQKTILVGKFW